MVDCRLQVHQIPAKYFRSLERVLQAPQGALDSHAQRADAQGGAQGSCICQGQWLCVG